jgi:AcrR family transcriptional regulator
LQRAALELFASAGYRGTTTPALARGAGIAEGTIYRHFTGKQHLYNVVYQATQAWAADLVAEVDRDHGPDARVRLERIARRLTESADRDPAAVHMLLARPASGLLDDTSRVAAGRFNAAVERIVAEGKAAGTVRSGPADLWATVWLEVVALALHRITRKEWQPDSPHTRQTLEAAWAAIAGDGAADRPNPEVPA